MSQVDEAIVYHTKLIADTHVVFPGNDCPNGGTRISSGIDFNRNGKLDKEEVTMTMTNCKKKDRDDQPNPNWKCEGEESVPTFVWDTNGNDICDPAEDHDGSGTCEEYDSHLPASPFEGEQVCK